MPFFLHQIASDDDLIFLDPIRVAMLIDRSAIRLFLDDATNAGNALLQEPAAAALIRRVLAPIAALDPREPLAFRRALLRIVETEEPEVLGDQDRMALLQAALDWATGIPDVTTGAIATWAAANLPLLTTPVTVPGLGPIYSQPAPDIAPDEPATPTEIPDLP